METALILPLFPAFAIEADHADGIDEANSAMDLEIPGEMDFTERATSLLQVDSRGATIPPHQSEQQQRPKKKRFRYSLKFKMQIAAKVDEVRTALSTLHGVNASLVPQNVINDLIWKATGVPSINVFKWYKQKAKLEQLYNDKKVRRKKRIGSSKRPLFPEAEASTGALAREKRKEGKIVTKSWFVKLLKERAGQEKPEKAAKARFSPELIAGALRRQGLALRFPSCTKAMSLENGVITCRGFFQWLRLLIRDELPDGIKRAMGPLDTIYGRFPLDCRGNKDEVYSF